MIRNDLGRIAEIGSVTVLKRALGVAERLMRRAVLAIGLAIAAAAVTDAQQPATVRQLLEDRTVVSALEAAVIPWYRASRRRS